VNGAERQSAGANRRCAKHRHHHDHDCHHQHQQQQRKNEDVHDEDDDEDEERSVPVADAEEQADDGLRRRSRAGGRFGEAGPGMPAVRAAGHDLRGPGRVDYFSKTLDVVKVSA